MAGVREVEALVAERKIGDLLPAQRLRQADPVVERRIDDLVAGEAPVARALARLAAKFGTPLYVYDAATVRAAYRDYIRAFRAYRPVTVSYAIKACPLTGVSALLAQAGADASAASLGELLAARRGGFPASRVQLHGNAKTADELKGALRSGVGRIVIDGAEEIATLAPLVRRRRVPKPVWLRVSPGTPAETHPHLRTGALDSTFGAPLATSSQRGGTAFGVGVSLGTTVIFLMLVQLTVAVGGKGIVNPELAAWLPGIVFLAVGAALLARVRT